MAFFLILFSRDAASRNRTFLNFVHNKGVKMRQLGATHNFGNSKTEPNGLKKTPNFEVQNPFFAICRLRTVSN